MKTVTLFFAASFAAVQLRRRFLVIAGTSAAVWGLGLARASAQPASAIAAKPLPQLRIGYQKSAKEMVEHLGRLTQEAGLDGVVCSPLEAGIIRDACGPGFITVTPGVRPAGGDVGDQKRITTPSKAIAGGSTYIVVGRPITKAADVKDAARKIVEEMRSL